MCRIALSLLLTAALIGCGGKVSTSGRETAAKAFQDGKVAFDGRDYKAAVERLSAAIDAGFVNPDIFVDAHVMRAVSYAATGNLSGANADLEKLKNAPDQSRVLAARAFILNKQGKAAEAKATLQQAKKLNPGVTAFD